MTKEDFIKKAQQVHGERYLYDNAVYKNYDTKLEIICKEHGSFWQTPGNHLKGKGCPHCNGNAKMTKETFIEKARQVWGDEFNYSKVDYVNNCTKVCILDKDGKEYFQTPANHLYGYDCRKGAKPSTHNFVIEANKIHKDKYDYSKVDYTSASKKICIICPEHGEFWQLPYNHLNGQGCPKCKKKSILEHAVKEILEKNNFAFEEQKHFKWLGKKSIDFYLSDKKIAIECQGKEHLYETGQWEPFEIVYNRDVSKFEECSANGIELIYVKSKRDKRIPQFYKDKILVNTEDLLTILNEK